MTGQQGRSKMRIFVRRLAVSLAPMLVVVVALNLGTQAHEPTPANGARQRQQQQRDASCHGRELELCALGISSIFQNPNGLPADAVELKRQCDYFNESAQCLDEYGQRCLTSVQLPLVAMFAGDLADLGRQFCSQDSDLRRNYTKHVACLRQVQHDYQRPCLTDLQVGFEAIHKIEHSLRFATTCCNLNRLKECIFGPIGQECGEAAAEMVAKMIEKVAGSLLSLACRHQDPFGDQCQRLLPKIGSKPYNGRNTSALSRVISGFTNVPAQNM